MRKKLLRIYCYFVTLLSFYFYFAKFEPNLDIIKITVKRMAIFPEYFVFDWILKLEKSNLLT